MKAAKKYQEHNFLKNCDENKPFFLFFSFLRISFLAPFLLLIASCSPEQEVPTHTLNIDVRHHTVKVPFTHVFIKENTGEFPGFRRADYDFFTIADENAMAVFDDLLPGTHYLMGLGHDGVDSVKGYRPVEIDVRDADRKQKVFLYVTE